MFEKEAEDSFKCKKVLYKWETDKHSYIDGFKDGTEFGYNKAFVEADKNLKAIVTDFNKANEWHFVSKEGFPNKDDIYLIIRSDGLHLGDYCCGETEILIVKVGAIIQVKKKYKTIVLSLGKKLHFQRR